MASLRKIKPKKKKVAKNAMVMVMDPFMEEQFIPTGSIGFDVLFSRKALGVKVGTMIEIAGSSGCGKSTSLFAMACRQARESGIKMVYLDSEGGIDRDHIDLNNALDLFNPKVSELQEKYGDKISDFIEAALDGYSMVILQGNSFDSLDKITAAVIDYSENHDEAVVFIIDSLAFLGTLSELKDMQSDKAWVAQKAKAFRAWVTLNKINLQAHSITTFFVNHLTMTGIGGFMAKPKEDSATGLAARYAPDIRVLIKEGEKIYNREGEIIGHLAKVYTKKCRKNVSHRQVIIPLMLGTGPDNARFLKEVLADQDLVKFSAWTTFDFPFLEEPVKVQGSEGAIEWIRDHENQIRDYLLEEGLLSLSNIGVEVKDSSSEAEEDPEIDPDEDDE